MDFKDCIQFITESQATCTLCTIDGDQPRGRGMVPLWVKDDGIYFTTAASKNLYAQLRANAKGGTLFCHFAAHQASTDNRPGRVY